MKMKHGILIGLLCAAVASAQHAHDEAACDCPSCQAEKQPFSLPGVGTMDPARPEHEAHDACEHEHTEAEPHDDQAGHDHAEEESVDPHAGHDHAETDEHAGHDHDTHAGEGGVHMDADELLLAEASGGTIARTSVFPAEIKLNRDRTASVSPRYASVVRQVFAEIGDEVRKGDVLASLENRETLAVYTIAAPLDGVIIAKDLAVGETSDADAVLYEVADLSTVWADISIFPQYQHLIRRGMPVTFMAQDGHTAEGQVKYISPIVSHETRTFTARCILRGAGEDFTPGVFVRARIIVESEEAAVRIPREAVQQVEGEAVVFVPAGDDFITRPVKTGLADEHFIEIRQGLQPGERYVEGGAFLLKAELITSGMDPHAGHGH